MANRQYIGARYVPKVEGEWVANVPYEPLTIVTYMRNSYTSKKPVPANIGAPSGSPEYWALTGNYNAQIEEFASEIVSKASVYKNVSEMINDDNLGVGKYAETLSYANAGDMGGGKYIIGTTQDPYGIALNNGLYANLVHNDTYINVAQFGVLPSVSDNTTRLNDLIDHFGRNTTFYFPSGVYDFAGTILVNKGFIKFVGDKHTTFRRNGNAVSGYKCTFNGESVNWAAYQVFVVVGPAIDASTSEYTHSVEFSGITFTKVNTNSCYLMLLVGTAYLVMDKCYAFQFKGGINPYYSFGMTIDQCQITGIIDECIVYRDCTNMFASNSSFESVGSYASLTCRRSKVSVDNCIINQSWILSDGDGAKLCLNNCQCEHNEYSLNCGNHGKIVAYNCIFERHQDSTFGTGKPVIYCVDGASILANGCKFYFQNYSGETTWSNIPQYSVNNSAQVVILNSTFEDFPTFTHVDYGADYVVIENNYEVCRKISGTATPSSKVSITGLTLKKINKVAFLTATFECTSALSANDEIMTLSDGFSSDGTSAIVFLTQGTSIVHGGYIMQNKIYTYESVEVGTDCMIYITYLCG